MSSAEDLIDHIRKYLDLLEETIEIEEDSIRMSIAASYEGKMNKAEHIEFKAQETQKENMRLLKELNMAHARLDELEGPKDNRFGILKNE